MVISNLSVYNNVTLNKSRNRPGRIVRLTPHCYVGQVTAEQGVDYLARKDGASVNYVVDKDGRVGCNIPEDYGAWTSSSKSNDEIAITFELACDKSYPYAMNEACINGFINLVLDICKRYNRNKVVYISSKDEALAYSVSGDEFLITFHRWFANTACPGDWFLNNADSIFKRVNEKLSGSNDTPNSNTSNEPLYTVQLGAYSNLDNANRKSSEVDGSFVSKVGEYYKVFVGKGSKAEMTQLRSSSYPDGFVTLLPEGVADTTDTNDELKVGDVVRLERGCPVYNSDRQFASWVYDKDLFVRKINGNRVVVSTLREGAVTGAVDIKYIIR